jgi:hypothetical protein
VTLVLEDQSRVVAEIKSGVSEFWVFPVCRKQHEPAAHSQVRDQRAAVIEIEENVLAATMDEIDLSVPEFARKGVRRCVGCESFSQQQSICNAASTDEFVERAGDKFYFG